MAERRFPDEEIQSSLESFGSWQGWLGQSFDPDYALLALVWMADQGDELPEELVKLRDALASFGLPPIDEAVDRVNGLEKAFRDVQGLMKGLSGNTTQVQRIEEIVESCVRFSGAFAPDAETAEGDG